MSKQFYDFTAKSISGKTIKMETYKGKVILVVNTASECGLTPQYEGLENLYQKYKDKGLVVLGFPCNQFGGQEPGSEKDIQQGCLLNYGVSFPMFSKVDVNGPNTHPIFDFLKAKCRGLIGKSIKWNFTKFLIDTNGNPIDRYAPTTLPENMAEDIESLLTEKVT
jgi:glutathione peroxidase